MVISKNDLKECLEYKKSFTVIKERDKKSYNF